MKWRAGLAVPIVLAGVLGVMPWGCDFLPLSGIGGDAIDWVPSVEKPQVEVDEPELVSYPGLLKLGAWFCPVVFDDFLTRELCQGFLGPVPPQAELIFRFRLSVKVSNPNDFPLPAVELLTAVSLFPGEASHELAALCLSFCEEDDPECLQHGPGTCSSDEPEVTSVDDLVDAAWNYLALFVQSRAAGTVPPELKVRLIPANSDAMVVVTLDLFPEAVVDALEVAYRDHLDEILDEEKVTIRIPYEVRGAIWFVVENFGRFGVNFGPVDGSWTL